MMPKRVQRKRTKGWRMPPNTIYVGRPTRWGNPYAVSQHYPAERVVEMYRKFWGDYLANEPGALDRLKQNLGGRDLACWCKIGDPCHADVLLELANPAE